MGTQEANAIMEKEQELNQFLRKNENDTLIQDQRREAELQEQKQKLDRRFEKRQRAMGDLIEKMQTELHLSGRRFLEEREQEVMAMEEKELSIAEMQKHLELRC